ncbi:MAG: 50S ribosomal protein L25 [Vulcanimicrobiota bacterium]
MKQVTLETKIREGIGKEHCKKLRQNALIPAVLYGKDTSPVTLTVPEREFKKIMSSGSNVLIELKLDQNGGASHLAMVTEIQKDPLGKKIQHIDFHKVSLDTRVSATVPIHLVGEPSGVKTAGGVLEHMLWAIDIETLPLSIPNNITVNVAHLGIEDSFTVKDLNLPEIITVLNDPNEVIAIVHAPRAAEASEGEAAASAAAIPTSAATPEVVKKGKEEKEGK